MDLEKILTPVLTLAIGGLVTWAGPAALRAFRNRGKTDLDIALEAVEREMRELNDAVDAAKAAHADDDPTNDALADARVAAELADVRKAREVAESARRIASMLEGIAEVTKT